MIDYIIEFKRYYQIHSHIIFDFLIKKKINTLVIPFHC